MQHLDEGTIHAWLDGELPPAEAEAAEAHVAACDECKAAVAEARGFIAASSRILMALDAVPGGVLPASGTSTVSSKTRVPGRFVISRAWMAAAAVLVLSTATVISLRPRREVATTVASAPMVAAAPEPSPAPSSAAPAEKSANNAPQARRADEPSHQDAGKMAKREEARAKDIPNAARASDSAPMMVADAVREPELKKSAPADRAPAAPAAEKSSASAGFSAPMVAQAPAPATPSYGDTAARRHAALNSVLVSGAGNASSAKTTALDATSDSAIILSRNTSASGADTIVTTVYRVRGVPVTLVDRSAASTELRLSGKIAPSARPTARLRDTSVVFNNLTWTDSTGRTRTLRGAVSQAELQRIKSVLFGATP